MSLFFLLSAVLLSSLSLFLFYKLYIYIFQEEERLADPFFFVKKGKLRAFWKAYCEGLSGTGADPFLKSKPMYIAFYLSLHFLCPLWGFAFFLQSDGNFLVVIVSIFLSLQLHHRAFSQAS